MRWRRPGTGPVSTRRFFKCPRKNFTLNNHQNPPRVPLPTAPRRAEFKRDGPGARRAGAQLLTGGLCRKGIGSVRFLLVTAHQNPQSPGRFPPLRERPRARTRQRCVLVYLRVRPCLQQLSEIIRLYHVMPHVGIFPAVPERLFCFLRLASARRNAAY